MDEIKPYQLLRSDFIPYLGMYQHFKRCKSYRPDFFQHHDEWCRAMEGRIKNSLLLVAYNNAVAISAVCAIIGLESLLR